MNISSTDTRFFTNEPGNTVLDRFDHLIKDSQYFDCIVGYFYVSGFLSLSKSLEKTEKIRILIGISTNRETHDLIQAAEGGGEASVRILSHRQAKDQYKFCVREELAHSEDSYNVEKGIRLFIKWIQTGKLEIRAYKEEIIHAKLYIMSYPEGSRDEGRVITGSSNFSRSGLEKNIEFNVELKDHGDYIFAKEKFEELWEKAVSVSDDFITTIQKDTWVSNQITPYELYLKFLYEYLKEQINRDLSDTEYFLPDGYMELQYQKDAVTEALQKLDEYNGVFISDVVGLGKTYITAMILKALNSRALILAPPPLVDPKNPGSWPRVLEEFGVGGCHCESTGKLEHLPKETNIEKYRYVVIDEAHKFRNENTQMYDALYRICIGKKVILVTATPLNNTPMDILAQIKLFQLSHASTLPNPTTRDLEKYFSHLQKKLQGLDRQNNKKRYLQVVRENSECIRKDVLQYLMIRRTRSNIVKYYSEDLKKQNLKFPEVADPQPQYYHFDEKTDEIFIRSIEKIVKEFHYSRYQPLLYLKKKDIQMEVGQKNMARFMRTLLLKRLESSFCAFRMSMDRMIRSYKTFIRMYQNGIVYTSDSSVKNLTHLLDEDNFSKINELIEEGRVQKHNSDEFIPEYINELNHDLAVLEALQKEWESISSDPKLEKFIKVMRSDQNLVGKKILIFTEAKETADYLAKNLEKEFGTVVLSINGSSDSFVRQQVIDNFDGNVPERDQKNDFRILVTTEVLAEGMNLHRSNVVINYDIPWNPTRMIQRVGRVNRVNTQFDWIYIYNFFPAGPINEEIGLEELAEAKIEAFIEMLGNDAKLLTDEEIKSHDLFKKLKSAKTITGEEEDEEDPELEYLSVIRKIRDSDPELFDRIQKLPIKARVGRKGDNSGLVTFFRKGKVRKIYRCDGMSPVELDFGQAAKLLEAKPDENSIVLPPKMYEYLGRNKEAFDRVFLYEGNEKGISGNEAKLLKFVRALKDNRTGFTDEEITYVLNVETALEAGAIPKQTIKSLYNEIKQSHSSKEDTYRRTYNHLRKQIDHAMILQGKLIENQPTGRKEIILSEYFGE